MRISLIAAADEGGVIGKDGHLPWHLPADLARFKQITLGHHVIMGRRTFESIGKPLPKRKNLVLTRSTASASVASPGDVATASAPGAAPPLFVPTFERAIEIAEGAGETEAFVIGGAEVFARALPLAERLYLTRVHATVAGDTHLPPVDPALWCEVAREEHPADERHDFAFALTVLERHS